MPDGGGSFDGGSPSEGSDGGGLGEPDDAESIAVGASAPSFKCCCWSSGCCSTPPSSPSPSANEIQRENTIQICVYRMITQTRCEKQTKIKRNLLMHINYKFILASKLYRWACLFAVRISCVRVFVVSVCVCVCVNENERIGEG